MASSDTRKSYASQTPATGAHLHQVEKEGWECSSLRSSYDENQGARVEPERWRS